MAISDNFSENGRPSLFATALALRVFAGSRRCRPGVSVLSLSPARGVAETHSAFDFAYLRPGKRA